MPVYSEETQKYHIERVREVLALMPRAGVIAIEKVLQNDVENPLIINRNYILKLKKKIAAERKHRFDQTIVDERLAEMQDRKDSIQMQMWRIVLNQAADERVRVAAAKVIWDSEKDFFGSQMDAGIFERKLGTVKYEHEVKIAEEQRILIVNAFKNYGIVKRENNEISVGRNNGESVNQ